MSEWREITTPEGAWHVSDTPEGTMIIEEGAHIGGFVHIEIPDCPFPPRSARTSATPPHPKTASCT